LYCASEAFAIQIFFVDGNTAADRLTEVPPMVPRGSSDHQRERGSTAERYRNALLAVSDQTARFFAIIRSRCSAVTPPYLAVFFVEPTLEQLG
jgi:hypothetical protein